MRCLLCLLESGCGRFRLVGCGWPFPMWSLGIRLCDGAACRIGCSRDVMGHERGPGWRCVPEATARRACHCALLRDLLG